MIFIKLNTLCRLWQDAENRTVLANLLKKNLGQVHFQPLNFSTIRMCKTQDSFSIFVYSQQLKMVTIDDICFFNF